MAKQETRIGRDVKFNCLGRIIRGTIRAFHGNIAVVQVGQKVYRVGRHWLSPAI